MMLNLKFYFTVVLLLVCFNLNASAQKVIKAKQAHKHVGEIVTVCDTIFDRMASHYANLFYVRIGEKKLKRNLTIMFTPEYIYNSARPLNNTNNNHICVTGLVEASAGGSLIWVQDNTQINY